MPEVTCGRPQCRSRLCDFGYLFKISGKNLCDAEPPLRSIRPRTMVMRASSGSFHGPQPATRFCLDGGMLASAYPVRRPAANLGSRVERTLHADAATLEAQAGRRRDRLVARLARVLPGRAARMESIALRRDARICSGLPPSRVAFGNAGLLR